VKFSSIGFHVMVVIAIHHPSQQLNLQHGLLNPATSFWMLLVHRLYPNGLI
jgi:hypothetical protein